MQSTTMSVCSYITSTISSRWTTLRISYIAREIKPELTATFASHVNCSGTVDVADTELLARFFAENTAAKITDTGLQNADADGNGSVTLRTSPQFSASLQRSFESFHKSNDNLSLLYPASPPFPKRTQAFFVFHPLA